MKNYTALACISFAQNDDAIVRGREGFQKVMIGIITDVNDDNSGWPLTEVDMGSPRGFLDIVAE